MSRMIWGLVLSIIVMLLPAQALAQTARLGFSAGFGTFTGDDFEDAESGPTFGAEALFRVGPDLFLGGAFDYSSYGIEDIEENVSQIDIDALIRYYFPGEAARFFLGGVLGFSRESIDVLDVSLSTNGFAIGPTVGGSFPAGQVAIDLSFTGYYHSYGDWSADGETLSGTDSSGFRFVFRVGLGIPLGGVNE